ncbi:MAG: hypothetical protein F6K23_37440 [Okeania sp. SIO2C9]|uniref:hypothetical protein n=1 Tax=Okeania sp. SIO2C9 TaxID=2607791 RepID=UPI0013C0B9FF|nr:hypothetical protein [Okeania sp. SIO2C9]NEQ78181.1 hypothetical protein [Okeania sp. SIO2C9]
MRRSKHNNNYQKGDFGCINYLITEVLPEYSINSLGIGIKTIFSTKISAKLQIKIKEKQIKEK